MAALVNALSDAGFSRAKIDAIISKTALPLPVAPGFTGASRTANDQPGLDAGAHGIRKISRR